MKKSKTRKFRFSIPIVVVVFPLVFMLFVLMPAAYFLIQNQQWIIERRADELLKAEAHRVEDHLIDIFLTSQQINYLNGRNLQQGLLDDRSLDELQRYFFEQLHVFENVSSIYFANPQGGLADAGREATSGEYYLIETEDFVAGDFYKYSVDENGSPVGETIIVPDFDARTRGWYQNALAEGGIVLSDIYILFTGQDMAMTVSLPVYDKDGEFLGVVANDIFLGQLSNFLMENTSRLGAQAFLVDGQGRLVATSMNEPLFYGEEGDYRRLDMESSPSGLIQSFSGQISVEELGALQEARKETFSHAGDRYFADIRPVGGEYGLDWFSVVIFPETDFIDDLILTRRFIFLVFLLLTIFSFVFQIIGARWLLRPLMEINRSMAGFSIEHPKKIYTETRINEVETLSESFNALVDELEETLALLKIEAEKHRLAKEALVLSEERYRSAVEDAPGLVCTFLPDGEITFVNQRYAAYYDTTPEALIGVNFLSLLAEDEAETVMQQINVLSVENPVGVVKQRVRKPDGEERRQRWVNRAIFNDKAEIIAYQSFGEDIEDEYRIQALQSALYRIAQVANRVLDLDELCRAIHELIKETIPATNFSIVLLDETNKFILPIYFFDEMDDAPVPARVPLENTLSSHVIETGETLRCTPEEFFAQNPDFDPNAVVGVALPTIWMGVPLIVGGKVVGVMIVQDYHNENAYSEKEQEFFEFISSSIAANIMRRRAEEEMLLYAQENALLVRSAQELNSTLEINELYEILYTIISESIPSDFVMISSYAAREKLIYCEYFVLDGKKQDVSEYPPLPLNQTGGGTQSKVILTGQSILFENYHEQMETSQKNYYINPEGALDDVQNGPEITGDVTRSSILAPLIFNGEVIGVLQVMSRQPNAYRESDRRMLEALCAQIAIASNNVRLFAQLQSEVALRREAEERLQSLNIDLEARVEERTAEINKRVNTVEKLNAAMANVLQDLNLANKVAEDNARQLESANTELEAFSYSVSHDLRAPLRHIESFTQLLSKRLDGDLDQASQRYLENILAAAERMKNLIGDLLSLSRAGRMEFHTKKVDLNTLIENVRTELQSETEGRQIVWKLALLPTVWADDGLMKIVWTNLIGNAVKYTRREEEALIEIGILPPGHARSYPEGETFFIRDNGVGFDPAYTDKLFGVFQRLHQQDEFEGNGIGLATVRRIIQRHGGEVWAEGNLDHGATFYFSLPKNKPEK